MDWDSYGTDFAGPISSDEDFESVTVDVPEILSEEEKRVLQDQLSPLESIGLSEDNLIHNFVIAKSFVCATFNN